METIFYFVGSKDKLGVQFLIKEQIGLLASIIPMIWFMYVYVFGLRTQ